MQKCGTRAGAESDEAGVVEGGSHCLHGGFKSSVLRSPHGPALASILIAWGIVARDLDARIFKFACRIVDLYEQLHVRNGAARELGRQLLRSGTSVGANYAEAAAGQTKADFIARLAIARRESRESLFWLRLIEAKGYLKDPGLAEDVSEAQQLTAILRAIIIKARSSPRRG
jgi:four helix bundle protein